MMQKKYLLVSLLAAAALLSGCSDSGSDKSPEHNGSSPSAVRSDGLTNPYQPEPKSTTPAKTFEDGAMEVVTMPKSVTENKDFVPVTFPKTSGSVVETDDEVTVVYNNTFEKEAIHQWVKDLQTAGWQVSTMDTTESSTSYVTVLTKDDRMISLYANNTDKTKNTVISFSK